MKIFSKVWNWIEGLFSKIENKVEELVPVATGIAEGVKKAVNNPTVLSVLEVIKFTIPGDTDDKIIDKGLQLTQKYAPKVLLQLQIIGSITEIENTNDQMIAVVDVLKKASKEEQSKYWHELSKQVLYAFADGKCTWGEAGAIVEYHYRNYVQPKQ